MISASNKRACPVCDSMDAKIIMRFTPSLLAEANPSYSLETLQTILYGKEEGLTYSRCHACGMLYCESRWDEEILNKVYSDAINHVKSREKALVIDKRLSLMRIWMNILRIQKLLGKGKLDGFKVIDFGCGWGDLLDIISGIGVDVMGYDEDAAKTGSSRKRRHSIAEDVDQLTAFGPVDVVVMNSVLEHLQNVKESLRLVKRLLKPDGLFVLGVMDYRSRYIRRNIQVLANNLPALTKNLNPIEHVNVYDYDAAVATVEKYEFDFFSTGHVLRFTDWVPCHKTLINLFNTVERISTKFISSREMSITVYAQNRV